MIRSMTAYASRTGNLKETTWTWEMRGVNGRGLDFKSRLPDTIGGLEAKLRAAIKGKLHRGVVTLTLRLAKDDSAQDLLLDDVRLEHVLSALDQVQNRAFALGVTLGQPTTADVLSQRGVIVATTPDAAVDEALVEALTADFDGLLSEFLDMRTNEGKALLDILSGQLSRIEGLVEQAKTLLSDRTEASRTQLKEAVTRLLDATTDVGNERLEQELALIAVKQDVTEEVDRLAAHVSAARDMLKDENPVGRKLDFLTQEFNREANTLCAKSQYGPLTSVGLELKAVIDQMREQVQNVE